MINPFKIKSDGMAFAGRHPKFVMFLQSVMATGVQEGSVIDVAVTLPDGRKIESNMKISQEDVEFFKSLGELAK